MMENPTVVILSSQYCAPYPVDLTLATSKGDLAVADVNGNVIFKVKEKLFTLRERRLLLDAADNPIISFQQKILTAHNRWRVFRGDSSKKKDLLFSVRASSFFQVKTNLNVYLASNTSQHVSDFKVKGRWSDKSCTIHSRPSNNIIAKMHKKNTVRSVVMGEDIYVMTVYPNVDYTFIAALVGILQVINKENDDLIFSSIQ